MKIKPNHICYIFCLLITLASFTSCSDDDYYYPSVKQEFLTAKAGADGRLKSILTDEGKEYQVIEDASNTHLGENATLRVVSNYGFMAATDGTKGVKLFALLSAVSPIPQKAESFKGGIKTDPVDVLSIWMGFDYLNMMLDIKSQNGKHLFHFIEDKIIVDPDNAKHYLVHLTLYHDADADIQAYTKRAYLSVPLRQYIHEGMQKVTVYFNVHTYSGQVKTYEFEYIPVNK